MKKLNLTKAMPQSSIRKRGFSFIEVIVGLSLGTNIFSLTTLLLGVVSASKTETCKKYEGSNFYQVPSAKAFIKAIELNQIFAKALHKSDKAIAVNGELKRAKLRNIGKQVHSVFSSSGFKKAFPRLVKQKDSSVFSVILFKDDVLIGNLVAKQFDLDECTFSKVIYETARESFTYGVFTEGQSKHLLGLEKTLKGDPDLKLETEWVTLWLPNPMGMATEPSHLRFTYQFPCRR